MVMSRLHWPSRTSLIVYVSFLISMITIALIIAGFLTLNIHLLLASVASLCLLFVMLMIGASI